MLEKEIDKLRDKITLLEQKHNELSQEVVRLKDKVAEQESLNRKVKRITSFNKRGERYSLRRTLIQSETLHNYIKSRQDYFVDKSDGGTSIIEKFIGENVISRIGIFAILIGVGIGIKYSIELNWIAPKYQIILGLLLGLSLLLGSLKLRKSYRGFSGILFSGAMGICYFISYYAFFFHHYLSPSYAFVILLGITAITVWQALKYNREIVAIVGILGAYGIPTLIQLDQISWFFYGYIWVIGASILFLSFKRAWRTVVLFAMILSWILYQIYSTRMNGDIDSKGIFLFSFFSLFYLVIINYFVRRKGVFRNPELLVLSLHSIAFFGYGEYLLINGDYSTSILKPYSYDVKQLCGYFALFNALIHGVTVSIIWQLKTRISKLENILFVLFTLYIILTPAIFLQGKYLSVVWIAEATALFIVGRLRHFPYFEKIANRLLAMSSLMFLAITGKYLFVVLYDNRIMPLWYNHYVFELFLFGLLSLIGYLVHLKTRKHDWVRKQKNDSILPVCWFPAMFGLSLYLTLMIQIAVFWFEQDKLDKNPDTTALILISILFYSLFCVAGMMLINLKIKDRILGRLTLWTGIVFTVLYMIASATVFMDLIPFTQGILVGHFEIPLYYWIAKYIQIPIFCGVLVGIARLARSYYPKGNLTRNSYFFFYSMMLAFFSSEIIYLGKMFLLDRQQWFIPILTTVFWVVYALFLVIKGFKNNLKYLRRWAIFLVIGALLKLFFFDLQGVNNLIRTFIFIISGVILLRISFIYNRENKLWKNNNDKNNNEA